MEKVRTNREIIDEARAIIQQRIEESEALLDELMDDEPENEESRAYERWEDKVAETEDWVERCHEGWEELHQLAIKLGVEYEEGDWIC